MEGMKRQVSEGIFGIKRNLQGVDTGFCPHSMNPDRGKLRRAAGPPHTLNVHKFAESRASELESLHSIRKERLSNDFRSQRSKRRRTTGHDNRVRKKQKTGEDNVNNPYHLKKDKKDASTQCS
ncbi:hypothetical protein HAX54_031358 [Datura stramonium]|uniref:Uncharacterized protein n=1 Tax=Datura stramonium TaxID=4076 RepID=A0ABS8VAG6_DATST|nr:hypothetical protein [Datura stramonium]